LRSVGYGTLPIKLIAQTIPRTIMKSLTKNVLIAATALCLSGGAFAQAGGGAGGGGAGAGGGAGGSGGGSAGGSGGGGAGNGGSGGSGVGMGTPNQSSKMGSMNSAPGKTVPGGGMGTGTGSQPGKSRSSSAMTNGTSN
jgi:hypothetical protein